jgi:molecular chaperone HscB
MPEDRNRAQRTVPAKCTACQRPLDTPLFCNSCRRLYPADGLSYFELLGLAPRYDVDTEAIHKKYLDVVRAIHPDRMAPRGADVQRLSLRVSARLNQAIAVLQDPVLRAEYLLELAGGPAASDDKHVPQQVLADTLTLREEIDEARAADDPAALDDLRRQVQQRFDAALAEIAALARGLPGDERRRQELRGKLNAIRYYRKLVEQL